MIKQHQDKPLRVERLAMQAIEIVDRNPVVWRGSEYTFGQVRRQGTRELMMEFVPGMNRPYASGSTYSIIGFARWLPSIDVVVLVPSSCLRHANFIGVLFEHETAHFGHACVMRVDSDLWQQFALDPDSTMRRLLISQEKAAQHATARPMALVRS